MSGHTISEYKKYNMENLDAKILKVAKELLLLDSSKQNDQYTYYTGYLSALIFARLQFEIVDKDYHQFLHKKMVDLQKINTTLKNKQQTSSVPLEIMKPGKIEKVLDDHTYSY